MTLEARLGDPWAAGNPVGFAAVVRADERGRLLAEGERLLDDYGLNRDFVPRDLGGRLGDVSRMARSLRPVFRRDTSLGLGYGVTSFMAAVNVWAAGDDAQRRWLADVLCRGGRAAVCFHELAHGNDLANQEFEAVRRDGGLALRGRKEVINNADRAGALVVFARTDPRRGGRSHSLLLLDPATLPPGRVHRLPRFGSAGMRGCRLGGLRFDDCPVPAEAVVGGEGDGMETALRAFQVTRAVLPAMAIGTLDTQIRVTARFALARRLYGAPVTDIPHVRSILAGAFADALVGDCLSTVASRALHLLPREASVYSAAAKYLVPKLLLDAADRLALVLGARSYVREGEYAVFQKNLRDLPLLSLGHAGPANCQATIISQLGALAHRSWPSGDDEAPASLFQSGRELPALRYEDLGLSARGRDPLSASLVAGSAAVGEDNAAVRGLAAALVAELGALKTRVLELPPRDRTPAGRRVAFTLAARYALVLAGSACLNVWLHGEHRQDRFTGDDTWVVAALHRVAERLGIRCGPLPPYAADRLCAEVIARCTDPHSLDLDNVPLSG